MNTFRKNIYLLGATIEVALLFILALFPEQQKFWSLGRIGLIPTCHKSSQSRSGDLYWRRICTTRLNYFPKENS